MNRHREAGAALLVLMLVLAASAGLLVVAIERFAPPQRCHRATVERNLALVRRLAMEAHLRAGAFPADLDALAAATGLPAQGSWRRDPYGAAADLVWSVAGAPATATVRSRGADGVLGTADDLTFALTDQLPGRQRSRDRLRLLRARLVAWQVGAANGGAGMTNGDRDDLRQATRDSWSAMRGLLYADAAGQAALAATMAAALADLRTLRTNNGVALPASLTGAGGLMAAIGLPEALASDGFLRPLLWHEAIGAASTGGDAAGGTSDDF